MSDLVSRLLEATDERWLPAPGYGSSYEVSDRGRVRSSMKGRPRLLSPYVARTGHVYVTLFREGKATTAAMNALVAKAFLPPDSITPHVRHIDGDLTNNSLANLRFEDLGSEGEEWRPVVGWEGRYWVSDRGRVRGRRRDNGGLMSTHVREGYVCVQFCRGAKHRFQRVHRLVALAFLGPPASDQEVRHLDGNPSNNHLENLAWGTHAENRRDQLRHGTDPMASKTHCKWGHPFAGRNLIRLANGRRRCRDCSNAAGRRYRERQRRGLSVEEETT